MHEVYLELCEQKPVLLKEFEKLGVKLIYYQIDAAMDLQSLAPIKKLEDLRGKKIAIAGGWPQRIVSAVGVTPVPVVLAERPVALQTKMIDGTICPLTVAFPFKFHQWAKNVTYMRWGVDAGAVAVINLELFNSFPEDIQKTILEVGRDSGRKFVEMDLAFEAKAKEVFAAAGVTSYTFSDEDVRKWAELISDLPAQWVEQGESRGLPARDVMDTYLRLQREKGHKSPVQWKLGD
jgi:TRAP-type C4-dicarboxylate transport system substrate-binding protein